MWATKGDARVYSGYRVLARKNDRFLLAIESSGGGTGRFTDLAWVRLDPTSLADVNDVLGGDRCGGGQSGFRVEGRRVLFKADVTTVDVLRLADVTVPDTVSAMLGSGYFPCYGYVSYQYDVLAEHLRLESLTLRPDTQAAARETFRLTRTAGMLRRALPGKSGIRSTPGDRCPGKTLPQSMRPDWRAKRPLARNRG